MNRSDLQVWPILERVDNDLLKKLRMVYVYGESANSAIMITKDDQFHAVGNNTNGILGTGDLLARVQPCKILGLCNKQIKDFASSTNHVIALTKDGKIYSWGNNEYGQLGTGSTSNSYMPTLIHINDSFIVQVACNKQCSLARTSEAKIYMWGRNYSIQPNPSDYYHHQQQRILNIPNPTMVNPKISGTYSFTHMACNDSENFAVLNDGLYHFSTSSSNPNLVKINTKEHIPVEKIACGFAHILILSKGGYLYTWGSNNCHQLGYSGGNVVGEANPIKIDQKEMGKVLDIGTLNSSHISVALALDGRVFMWGLCRNMILKQPTLTMFESVHEALGAYGTPGIMHAPLHLETMVGKTSMIDCLKEAFNDPTSSDLIIQVKGEPIHVHKAHLKMRSGYFRTMFQGEWKENTENVIVHDHFSYEVYKCFLRFLYTDEVILPEDEDTFGELLNLADAYDHTDLKTKITRAIQPHITVQNAFPLYGACLLYHAEALETMCFIFILKNMTAVITSSSFKDIDEGTVKTFLTEAAKSNNLQT